METPEASSMTAGVLISMVIASSLPFMEASTDTMAPSWSAFMVME